MEPQGGNDSFLSKSSKIPSSCFECFRYLTYALEDPRSIVPAYIVK